MSFERKVNRNKLKKAQGNNKINKAWRYYQIKKYGIGKWCSMYNKSRRITNQSDKITPQTAYYI